jgi:hypothetical protein
MDRTEETHGKKLEYSADDKEAPSSHALNEVYSGEGEDATHAAYDNRDEEWIRHSCGLKEHWAVIEDEVHPGDYCQKYLV